MGVGDQFIIPIYENQMLLKEYKIFFKFYKMFGQMWIWRYRRKIFVGGGGVWFVENLSLFNSNKIQQILHFYRVEFLRRQSEELLEN